MSNQSNSERIIANNKAIEEVKKILKGKMQSDAHSGGATTKSYKIKRYGESSKEVFFPYHLCDNSSYSQSATCRINHNDNDVVMHYCGSDNAAGHAQLYFSGVSLMDGIWIITFWEECGENNVGLKFIDAVAVDGFNIYKGDDLSEIVLDDATLEETSFTSITEQVAAPVITASGNSLYITCATEGATIYGFTDNSFPVVISNSISVIAIPWKTSMIHLFATKEGMIPSEITDYDNTGGGGSNE